MTCILEILGNMVLLDTSPVINSSQDIHWYRTDRHTPLQLRTSTFLLLHDHPALTFELMPDITPFISAQNALRSAQPTRLSCHRQAYPSPATMTLTAELSSTR